MIIDFDLHPIHFSKSIKIYLKCIDCAKYMQCNAIIGSKNGEGGAKFQFRQKYKIVINN